MPELTPAERRALRAQAHTLKPVVLIGDAGLSEAVLVEIDRQLASHELIKVRIAGEDRRRRATFLETICKAVGAAPVLQIGRVIVLYRRKPDKTPADPGLGPATASRPRRQKAQGGLRRPTAQTRASPRRLSTK